MGWNQWLGQQTHSRMLAQSKLMHTACAESAQGQLDVAQMRVLINGSHFTMCKGTHPGSWRGQCDNPPGTVYVDHTLSVRACARPLSVCAHGHRHHPLALPADCPQPRLPPPGPGAWTGPKNRFGQKGSFSRMGWLRRLRLWATKPAHRHGHCAECAAWATPL